MVLVLLCISAIKGDSPINACSMHSSKRNTIRCNEMQLARDEWVMACGMNAAKSEVSYLPSIRRI